jgi:CubicO group peptidase (beta-lactamase class C family)
MQVSARGLATLDATMARFVTDGRRAGLVYGLMQGDRLMALQAHGQRDREAGKPMTTDTVFRLFSMTRAVSSVAFLTFVEAGDISLDDPVARYLPVLADMTVLHPADPTGAGRLPLDRPMTIRHLLTYTAGISYPFDWPEGVGIGLEDIISQSHDLASAMAVVARCPLVAQPGEKWRYGLASDILGAVIEVVSGQPLDRFMADTVLAPLGMADTGFWAGGAVDRLAKAYGAAGEDRLANIDSFYTAEYGDFRSPPRYLSAGGGLCSTVPDYLRFCRFLLSGETASAKPVIGPATRAEMLARQTTDAQGLCFWYAPDPDRYMRRHGWGLGIGVTADPPGEGVPHLGPTASWAGLMNTFFFIDAGADIAAVVMSQYFGPDENALGNAFRDGVYAALEA